MSTFSEIEAQLAGQHSQPPLDLWKPELSGDIDIVIRANGDWYHEGHLIERHALVKLFASILRRETDGHYYLVTPIEKWRLKVEDAPLLIVDFDVSYAATSKQVIIFTSNMGRLYPLGSEYPLNVDIADTSHTPAPYLGLDYGLRGKLTRAVFYRLVDFAEFDGQILRVLSNQQYFELGSIE